METIGGMQIYLLAHGLTTVGAVVVFLIRNEHRITKLEIELLKLNESHDRLTDYGTLGH